MNYKNAHEYAVNTANVEFKSNVMDTINNQMVSAATGNLQYMINYISSLTDIFETQKLAHDKQEPNWLEEFHDNVKLALEGDNKENLGLEKQLTKYFYIAEFERDPPKKKAIALYLKYYLTYIKNNVVVVTASEFLNLPLTQDFSDKYFNKEHVFGVPLAIVEKQLT